MTLLTRIHTAAISPSLAHTARNMIEPPKKNHITCLTLLADLAETSRHVRRAAKRSAAIAIMGARLVGYMPL